jgi:hypothetical protein
VTALTRLRIGTIVDLVAAGAWTGSAPVAHAADPLPSWSDGAAKGSILRFVEGVGTTGSSDFVPVAERIAVFDHDGTLWAEEPIPLQDTSRATG